MSKSQQDQTSFLKTMLGELDERVNNMRFFDRTYEINTHCDDLVGQVTLATDSAIDDLNKNRKAMINEINSYRTRLLEADEIRNLQGQIEEDLERLLKDVEVFRSMCQSSEEEVKNEALRTAGDLKERAKELRRHMRSKAFNGGFLKFFDKEIATDDLIGTLNISLKDTEDVMIIKHVVLDEIVSKAAPFDLEPSPKPEDEWYRATPMLFLRDGSLAMALKGEPVIVWSLETNQKLFDLGSEPAKKYGDHWIGALVQLPNGHLVTGSNHGQVRIWDLQTRQKLKDLDSLDSGFYSGVISLKVLPNGNLVAFVGEYIHIWDMSTLNDQANEGNSTYDRVPKASRIETLEFYDFAAEIFEWQKSSEGENIYLSKDYYIYFDHNDHEQLVSFQVNFEVFSNGNMAFSFVQPDRVLIKVWNSESRELVNQIELLRSDAESCSFLPSGEVVLCLPDENVELFNSMDGLLLQSFKNDKGEIVAIRPESRNSLQFVHLKDLQMPILASENARVDQEHNYADAVCISDDGKHLAIVNCIISRKFRRLTIWSMSE